MGEYYAWAVTGRVTGLESWAEPDFGADAGERGEGPGSVRIASRLVERQRFFLQQPNGQEFELNLVDSRLVLRNGQIVTAVWAARRGMRHGYCVMVENHTTGVKAQLSDKLSEIQPRITLARTARFGLIAVMPVALVLLLWLLIPGTMARANIHTLLLVGASAGAALFAIGLLISKLVLDYQRADDHRKIWQSAEEVAAEVRDYLRQMPKQARQR